MCIFAHNTLSRGCTVRGMEMSSMFKRDHSVGRPQTVVSLSFLDRDGKVNQLGHAEQKSIVRHRTLEMCPVADVLSFLHWQFDLDSFPGNRGKFGGRV